MVNKGRVALLTAALRSGLYVQGRNNLHSTEPGDTSTEPGDTSAPGGTWCCLGVAGDVAARFGLQVIRYQDGGCEYIDGSASVLGPAVCDWYGFDAPDGDVRLYGAYGAQIMAASWNDQPSSSFAQIAAGFERTFLTQENAPGENSTGENGDD